MGEQIKVGERRVLLVDGGNPSADAVVTPSRDGVVTIAPADANGEVVVTAVAAIDSLDITVTESGRAGTDSGISVSAAAFVVTLGDPLP